MLININNFRLCKTIFEKDIKKEWKKSKREKDAKRM